MRCQLALFSAYRVDQYGDPEGFKASLGLVLEQYPNEVILYVCDPRTGVQRHCKWPPTISEIVEACDARVADLKRKERFENWGKSDADQRLLEHSDKPKPTLEELHAKYGKDWGLIPAEPKKENEFKAPSLEQLQDFYARNPERVARLMGIEHHGGSEI